VTLHRDALPQLDGSFFLTDAGLETDLIFNHGVEIPCFAAHTLLAHEAGRAALRRYFEGFLDLAASVDAGFVLDTVTWRAHRFWAGELQTDEHSLRRANEEAIAFAETLRADSRGSRPIVINAPIGPRGDAYRPERVIAADDAEAYFAQQLGWLAGTEVDMVSALTFNQASEATGLVWAAQAAGLPAVVSFTVETDGRLPNGQPLGEAIEEVDHATDAAATYFMVNCAHPDHFADALDPAAPWSRRIRGIRANASRCSHAELDEAPELDAGDPDALALDYRCLATRLPWLNVFGGCCGSDLRHVRAIAAALREPVAA
jgi:S-methylmethionine-dependent homocysteine/selenocysteine methylase